MFESQMSTGKRSIAPIMVYTNGNKYDGKRFIFNPKYVRSFDALLDQLTVQTNATCAIRRIYTPQGRREVGNLSGIQPGGKYVAVSRGHFKKMPYGQNNNTSSEGTVTTKSHRRKPAAGRLQKSYEDQMKTQKTIYVHRNGSNASPIQIFLTKKLLRSMNQVLDLIQEKIVFERAIVSLHKVNGLSINEVTKLQPEGRYVAVEQGQRFKRIAYGQVESSISSPRKLPLIKYAGNNTWRSTSDGKPLHSRLPSNESNQGQTSRGKPKLKLPAIKQNLYEPAGFQVIYGYPRKEAKEITTYRYQQDMATFAQGNYDQGVFHATGAQRQNAAEIYDDKRVRVDKPLDMTEALEVEEELDNVDYHGRHVKPRTQYHSERPQARESQSHEPVTLPQIARVPKPPTKPSIAHPRRHKNDKRLRSEKPKDTVPQSMVNDQRFVSKDNSMANSKQYIVTREQRLLGMHGRDGREPASNVVHVYAADARTKGLERKSHEIEKQKRIEDWVDQTVGEKEKEDEISAVAKQLVVNAIRNAGDSLGTDVIDKSYGDPARKKNNVARKKNNVASFYDDRKTNEIKYHKVFGT